MRKREANIEIMRIVLFFMVVCLHVVSPYLQTRFDKFHVNWQFSAAIASLSRLCTNCFVLISGYFYASARNRRAWSIVSKLLLPVAVGLPFYFLLDLNLGFGEAFRRVLFGLLKNEYNLYHLWFVQVFLIISLLSPFFATAVDNMNRRQHQTAIVTLLITCSVIPSFCHMTGLYWFDLSLFESRLVLFATLYIIGAYIKNYPFNISVVKSGVLAAAAQIFVVLGNVLYNTRYSPVNLIRLVRGGIPSLEAGAAIETSGLAGAFCDPGNIFIVTASAFMLMFFAKLSFNSGRIVKIARNVYGAYIIHVFWIQFFSRVGDNYFNLYSARWLDSDSFPLFILIFIATTGITSLFINSLLSKLYRIAAAYVRSKVIPPKTGAV